MAAHPSGFPKQTPAIIEQAIIANDG